MLDAVYVDRPGHQAGQRPPGLRRRGQEARRPAAGHRAGEPRRLGRVLPRPWTRPCARAGATTCCSCDDDVKLEPEGILRAVDLRRPGPQADDRRRPHVQHVRPRRCCTRSPRPSRPHSWWWGDRAEHQGPARLRPPQPAQHPVAAPPGRRRLQRLVDVPDPDRRSITRDRPRACRSSSSGTTPSTGCGPATRATRRCRCPAWPPGTCRGRTRTTPWTGRPTTTCATGSSPRCCTRRSRAAAAWSPRALERQLQNLLSMQYSTAALRLLAIEDVLTGPAHLHRDLPTKMAELRELRQRYTDAQARADMESFPPARRQGRRTALKAPPRRPTRSTC